MTKKKWRLVHLHRSSVMTRPLLRKIIALDTELENLYRFKPHDFVNYFSLPSQRANQLFSDLHDSTIIESIKNDRELYHITTVFDSDYPLALRTINDPPYVLYLYGNSKLFLQMPALSIVGTRNPTFEARQKMAPIIVPLIKMGWTIVSGMASGIDGIAHQLAIENNGRTIAVLGSGFSYIYPRHHENLFFQLATTQLIVSEYPPSTPPKRYHFPERNRIISGLSYGTLVVEAQEKSGSLITVDQALDQGREVYAIPGSPLQKQTKGCHKLIQDGAKLVQSAYDLVEDWENQKLKWSRFLSELTEK
ncbi:DNA-processing protein DprA [Aquibacillus kalidii]|uniref:DNA-processing protein DprA n=1 Tax=Aquibacillus kalidii TaxID=2762597 RepID=UPI001644F09B|nr:DNA-processing protein DprA [Aquibacillus kalidii]